MLFVLTQTLTLTDSPCGSLRVARDNAWTFLGCVHADPQDPGEAEQQQRGFNARQCQRPVQRVSVAMSRGLSKRRELWKRHDLLSMAGPIPLQSFHASRTSSPFISPSSHKATPWGRKAPATAAGVRPSLRSLELIFHQKMWQCRSPPRLGEEDSLRPPQAAYCSRKKGPAPWGKRPQTQAPHTAWGGGGHLGGCLVPVTGPLEGPSQRARPPPPTADQ